jgi:lipopolysaccharide export system protein LptA
MSPLRWASKGAQSKRILFLLLFVICSSLYANKAGAQEGCEFVYPSGDLSIVTLAGGNRITYVGTPHMLCSDGVEIWADSSISYAATGLDHLIGNIRFLDNAGELRADEARYFSEQGRLQASGNVFVQDTLEGFTIENGTLVYLRPTDFRKDAEITVSIADDFSRPHAILFMVSEDTPLANAESDEALGAPEEDSLDVPYIVEGDRIFLRGGNYFYSVGNVTIERDSILAFADSVEYDGDAERVHLAGSAKVEAPNYNLVGKTIDMILEANSLTTIAAHEEAILNGDNLTISSPEIELYMDDGLLGRLVAFSSPNGNGTPSKSSVPQPVAVGENFELTADSLDISLPDEVIEKIFAAGQARSISSARDSLNVDLLPEIAKSDWLEGDTIIVTFEPNAPAPSEGRATTDTSEPDYRIERIVARVGARTLYRLIPSDTTAMPGIDAPAIHYVTGDEITIIMNEGEADRLEVQGRTRGFHLEPLPLFEPDSLAVDSVAIDTLVAFKPNTMRDTGPKILSRKLIRENDQRPEPMRARTSANPAILNTWRRK